MWGKNKKVFLKTADRENADNQLFLHFPQCFLLYHKTSAVNLYQFQSCRFVSFSKLFVSRMLSYKKRLNFVNGVKKKKKLCSVKRGFNAFAKQEDHDGPISLT